MALARTPWRPGPVRCCDCGRALEVTRQAGMVTAGAAIVPDIPGAVCAACLEHVAGLAINDLRAEAAVHLIHTLHFERKTPEAVQAFLDLFGWEPTVIGACAVRLHADGKARDAYRLLDDARTTGPAGYFDVEKAALLLLDGETGQAHDLLSRTGDQDHPRWHLQRGVLAHSVGRPEAAAEHWRLQIQAHPDEPMGWVTLGFHLLQEQGDLTGAEDLFRRACAAHPRYQEFRAWLGDTLHRQGRDGEALTELEAARELEPVDAEFSAGVEQLIAEVRAGLAEGT